MDNINVLIDAYNLQISQGTGIRTYTNNLIKALNQGGVDISLLYGLYNQSDFTRVLESSVNQSKFANTLNRLQTIWRLINPSPLALPVENISTQMLTDFDHAGENVKFFNASKCYQTSFIKYKLFKKNSHIKLNQKIDIWHRTYPIMPILIDGCACNIVTIHDLIPLKLPNSTSYNTKWFYQAVGQTIQESQGIITDSECSKRDILELYDVDPSKVYVIYPAISNHKFKPTPDLLDYYLQKYQLQQRKYFLSVGMIEPRKNLSRLIDAYLRIDTDFPLVIVGKKGPLWQQELERINDHSKIKLLEYIDKIDLSYLYSGAYCLIFPSIYEGFGLPLLEAMGFGCPVIASHASCLPEVCGDAAIYINPYDVSSICSQIELLLGDINLREKLIIAGTKRVEFFSMENYSQALTKTYRSILELVS